MSIQNSVIPKKIHYCWFGHNPKPELIQRCIQSWHKFLPDYEIIEWNEDNFDISFCQFAQDAYHAKKWAFVSDVARLKVIYDHGGIYMDTDVELFDSKIFHDYLDSNAFFFFDNNKGINTGVGFGGKKSDPLIKRMIATYEVAAFTHDDLLSIACPVLNTPDIQEFVLDFKRDGGYQTFDNYTFIPESHYYKHAKHYGTFTWRSDEQNKALKYVRKNRTVSKVRQRLRSHAIFKFFRKYHLNLVERVYAFVVYDLFDYGIKYWLVRLWLKISNFWRRE